MVELLRPARGGFLRPFGCGWFIREFLLGHGPHGSPRIDSDRGRADAGRQLSGHRILGAPAPIHYMA